MARTCAARASSARRSSARAARSPTPTSGRSPPSGPTAAWPTARSSTRSCWQARRSAGGGGSRPRLSAGAWTSPRHRAYPRPTGSYSVITVGCRSARDVASARPGAFDMRILVTGGAGFIGSHYVRTVLAGGYPGCAGASVTVLDKLTYSGNLANLEPVAADARLTFVPGDICDAGLLAGLVPGHDLVLNFAAETHVDRSISGAAPFVATNVAGVQVLMQACLDAGIPRVVQVSTDEVYGSIATGSWPESAPLDPNSPYSAAKAGGDLIALAYHRTHGLNVVTTRCCNNYGPYQYPEKVIPLFITSLLDGLRVPLYGDGGTGREWVHGDDHCRGIQLAAERGEAGRVYHIGGDVELVNKELASM